MKESTTYQAILQEGEAKGMAEGIAQGKLKAARKMLLIVGRIQFGEPDARTLRALEAIKEMEHLETLALHVLPVTTWQQLLRLIPSPSPGSRDRTQS